MRYISDLIPAIDTMPTRMRSSYPEILGEEFWDCYHLAAPYSMVHVTGFYETYQALRYIATNGIRGDFVECGCFLGGMAIFIGLLRRRLGLEGRTIYVYDTFAGPPAGESDVVFGVVQHSAPLPPYYDAVRRNIADVLGGDEGFTLVAGCVEDTLPVAALGDLAFVRLDTDFYSSTKVELETLYPRLVSGGAIAIDDYGMYPGARRATDEFMAAQARRPLLHRIDGTVWAGVKP